MKRKTLAKWLVFGLCFVIHFGIQLYLMWRVPQYAAHVYSASKLDRLDADDRREDFPRIRQHHAGVKDNRGSEFRDRNGTLDGKSSSLIISQATVKFNNKDDPSILSELQIIKEQLSRPETRLSLLQNLESSLFSSRIDVPSDSSCNLPSVIPPDMCGNVSWECSLSSSFVQHDRVNRTLQVHCPGEFRINFISREESETLLANAKYIPDREWNTYKGPATVPFKTQYADVVCPMKIGKDIVDQHNYRTQFIPNVTSIKEQKETYSKKQSSCDNWQPLSILSINLDSMSRPHFHRPCGLPKTAQLLKDLYYSGTGTKSTHQAFLFNRLNSVGGVTAMNLTPLYAGLYLRKSDEEKRVLLHRYPRKINEWMWDYANSLGYLTSYGVDTGNGLFGTRTVCKTCTNRPGSLPHWEDGWVKHENKEIRLGVLAGLCNGDTFIHEHIMNYTKDFLNSDHPAKWAAFDLNAKHRPEPDSATQIDDSLLHLLTQLMKSQPNLVIFLFGDHGDRYHGNYSDNAGSYLEIFLPFLSIIAPRHVMEKHPEWERNLLINSQRYLIHQDIHHTMKSLMHYPALHNVSGHVSTYSYNLFTQVIPRSRTCSSAKMPYWSCVCGGPKLLPPDRWTEELRSFTRRAVSEINAKHSQQTLLHEDPTEKNVSTRCLDIVLRDISSIAAYEHEYAGVFTSYYHITFTSDIGPSKWQATIDGKGSIQSLKQLTRYQKYETCRDFRVSIEFCVCHQFPAGTP
ncbi:uncharacterized protein LOC117305514 [Asterias rubens]|uniref:uncharacterized protein LOC117305514 n=1 Tax=Asterias rubens TaxID=7604 RepID=UPI001455AB44|nr:uncharacterized protein LOC117305514 [Asterias rubens]